MAIIQGIGGLTGTVSGIGSLQGTIAGVGGLNGAITIPDTVDARPYEGEYLVVPNFEDQTLETNGKMMRDDVEVMAIPVTIVSNPSGGNTAIIGG